MLGVFSSLLFCFPGSREESKENEDLEGSLKLTDVKPGCVFCNVDRSHGFDIVLEVRSFCKNFIYLSMHNN